MYVYDLCTLARHNAATSCLAFRSQWNGETSHLTSSVSGFTRTGAFTNVSFTIGPFREICIQWPGHNRSSGSFYCRLGRALSTVTMRRFLLPCRSVIKLPRGNEHSHLFRLSVHPLADAPLGVLCLWVKRKKKGCTRQRGMLVDRSVHFLWTDPLESTFACTFWSCSSSHLNILCSFLA